MYVVNFARIILLGGSTGYHISLNSIHVNIPHVVVGTVKCIAPKHKSVMDNRLLSRKIVEKIEWPEDRW
jgi:hypothetical protein